MGNDVRWETASRIGSERQYCNIISYPFFFAHLPCPSKYVQQSSVPVSSCMTPMEATRLDDALPSYSTRAPLPLRLTPLPAPDRLRRNARAKPGVVLICGECFDEGEGDICFMLAEQ
jgi:hypothetical protein